MDEVYRLLGDELGWSRRCRWLGHGKGVGVPARLLALFLFGAEGVEVEHVEHDE
jgi:hypothetical protein